jgi:hypothetical protein
MKTILLSINEILAGMKTILSLFYEKYMIDHFTAFKWAKQVSSLKFSWNNLGHFILPLLKQSLKEALGTEIELEVLLLFVAGYFLWVKDVFKKTALTEKLKNLFQPIFAQDENHLKLI